MKRVLIILMIALLLVGCTPKEAQPVLRSLVSATEMIHQVSYGNLKEAWNPVYEGGAAADLEQRLKEYTLLFGGWDIEQCDCVDYTVTGAVSGPGEYEEITCYEITLDNGTVLYAQATAIRDANGEGIIDLVISQEVLW